MIDSLLVVSAVAVLVGSVAQRVTGLGFALVASPFLIMALGPVEGVVVSNICGFAAGMASLLSTWRAVNIKRTLRLAAATVSGFIPAMIVIRVVPHLWLALLVSALVLVALVVTLAFKPGRAGDSIPLSTGLGLASGFMAVSASVGGPPLAIYGRLTAWEHKEFVASMQALSPFILIAIFSAPSFPTFSVLGWIILAIALFGGVALGTRLAPRVSGKLAGRLVMAIAIVGTVVALGRALLRLATV